VPLRKIKMDIEVQNGAGRLEPDKDLIVSYDDALAAVGNYR
jgi:hypothetical protein